MGETAVILYLLGVYLHYIIGKKILELNDSWTTGGVELFVVSLLWPLASVYYMFK